MRHWIVGALAVGVAMAFVAAKPQTQPEYKYKIISDYLDFPVLARADLQTGEIAYGISRSRIEMKIAVYKHNAELQYAMSQYATSTDNPPELKPESTKQREKTPEEIRNEAEYQKGIDSNVKLMQGMLDKGWITDPIELSWFEKDK